MKVNQRLRVREIRGISINSIRIGKYSIGIYKPVWNKCPEVDKYPFIKVLYILPCVIFEYDKISWDIKFLFLRLTFGVWVMDTSFYKKLRE